MRVHVTGDLDEWMSAAAELLDSDPVVHTVPLSIAAMLQSGASWGAEAPWFAYVWEDGTTVGAALRTPPHLLVATDMPASAAAALAGAVPPDLPGTVARPDVATAIADTLGREMVVRTREVHYRLDTLTEPAPVAGEARPMRFDDDLDLVVAWTESFQRDANLLVRGDVRENIARRRIRGGARLWLWWLDRTPVAMAGCLAPVHGVPRIGPVYTPPEHRGLGYGAAITAAVCREAFADGATACTLFADAANPASNRVYTRLGFVAVRDVVEAMFVSPARG